MKHLLNDLGYVVKTNQILSSALDGVMLLGSVNDLLNNLCREKVKPILSWELKSIFDNSDHVTNYLLGMTYRRRWKMQDVARITSSSSSYNETPHQSNMPFNPTKTLANFNLY